MEHLHIPFSKQDQYILEKLKAVANNQQRKEEMFYIDEVVIAKKILKQAIKNSPYL